QNPDDYLLRRDLAQSLGNLANWYSEQDGRVQQAEETYKRAATIQERLLADGESPARPPAQLPITPFAVDSLRVRYDLALTYSNLARLYADADRFKDAEVAFSRSRDIFEHLVRMHPDRVLSRRALGRNHFFLGQMHQRAGEL